jgi:hypothetical protein
MYHTRLLWEINSVPLQEDIVKELDGKLVNFVG